MGFSCRYKEIPIHPIMDPHLWGIQEIILRSTVSEKALENACVTGGRINAQRAVKLASIYPAPRPPIHAPSHLQFVDTNPAVGRIGHRGENVVVSC